MKKVVSPLKDPHLKERDGKSDWSWTGRMRRMFIQEEERAQRGLLPGGKETWGLTKQRWEARGFRKIVIVKLLSHVWLFVTPWTVAHQASPSMGFSRQEYWSKLPFPSPGDLPYPGIERGSPGLRADAFTIWATREAGGWMKLRGKKTPWRKTEGCW